MWWSNNCSEHTDQRNGIWRGRHLVFIYMAGLVGILGTVPFVAGQGTAFTFHDIEKKRKNAFAKHRVINSNDLIEDVGFDPIELDIKMKFFSPWTLDPSL